MMRKCLVVGANGGMGSAISNRLQKENFYVIGTYHNSSEQLSLYKEGKKVNLYYLDLLNPVFDHLKNDFFSGITDVIFTAGKESLNSIMTCSRSEMIEQYDISVFSPLLIIQNIILKHNCALQNIVFISSTAACSLNPSNGMYALTKACVCNLTKMLDLELKDRGVRVNCIVPGWCETKMAERVSKAKGITIEEIKNGKINHRLVQTEEIAEICLFLLSDRARNIHGQFIGVDVPERRISHET